MPHDMLGIHHPVVSTWVEKQPDVVTLNRKRVGSYVIGKTLGEGAFAKVRMAVHLLSREKTAIKILNKRLVGRRCEYARRHLKREAAILTRLDHPHVIALYEVLETNNHFYLVTELVNNGSLKDHVQKSGCLSEVEARRYMRQLASAVDYTHRSGVMHRDLKIDNLMLTSDMDIKIIDFGLSSYWNGSTLHTTQCGSPAFTAPEVFNKQQYGPAVDVWSLGVNLHYMLTGRLPFCPTNNLVALLAAMLRGCRMPQTLTAVCQDLLRKMLDPAASQRITDTDLLMHPWLNQGYPQLVPVPAMSKITNQDISTDVINYMVLHLNVPEAQLRDCVKERRVTSATAIYRLLYKRVKVGRGLPDRPNGAGALSLTVEGELATTDRDESAEALQSASQGEGHTTDSRSRSTTHNPTCGFTTDDHVIREDRGQDRDGVYSNSNKSCNNNTQQQQQQQQQENQDPTMQIQQHNSTDESHPDPVSDEQYDCHDNTKHSDVNNHNNLSGTNDSDMKITVDYKKCLTELQRHRYNRTSRSAPPSIYLIASSKGFPARVRFPLPMGIPPSVAHDVMTSFQHNELVTSPRESNGGYEFCRRCISEAGLRQEDILRSLYTPDAGGAHYGGVGVKAVRFNVTSSYKRGCTTTNSTTCRRTPTARSTTARLLHQYHHLPAARGAGGVTSQDQSAQRTNPSSSESVLPPAPPNSAKGSRRAHNNNKSSTGSVRPGGGLPAMILRPQPGLNQEEDKFYDKYRFKVRNSVGERTYYKNTTGKDKQQSKENQKLEKLKPRKSRYIGKQVQQELGELGAYYTIDRL